MQKQLMTLLLFVGLLFTTKAFSQESTILTKGENGLYSYEKVFEIPGKSKADIFTAVKGWVIKTIKSQSNTNYFDETNQNSVSTTPAFIVSFGGNVNFKMNIEIKDGKYKLTANSFIYQTSTGLQKNLGDFTTLGYFMKTKVKIMADTDAAFKDILTSIESAANNKSDW